MQQSNDKAGSAGFPVNDIPFDTPWTWLAAGWRDLWQVWPISLAYGAVFAALAFMLLAGLVAQGSEAVILTLAAGFLLLGPLMAVGLYEASRRLETGEPVSFGAVVLVRTASPLQLGYLGAILMLLFLFWMRLAMVLFALFFGHAQIPTMAEFVPALLLTANGVAMLAVGSVVGGVLAVLVFTVSAVSVPLLMHRQSDFFTAVATSIKAMVENPKAMLLWAGIIAGLMLVGMATLFVGLAIIFPLIGHATWHAYRSVVVTDD
jgi:uncharacterized membrane protein